MSTTPKTIDEIHELLAHLEEAKKDLEREVLFLFMKINKYSIIYHLYLYPCIFFE